MPEVRRACCRAKQNYGTDSTRSHTSPYRRVAARSSTVYSARLPGLWTASFQAGCIVSVLWQANHADYGARLFTPIASPWATSKVISRSGFLCSSAREPQEGAASNGKQFV